MKKIQKYLPVAMFVIIIILIGALIFVMTNKGSSSTAKNENGNQIEAEKTNLPSQNNDPIDNIGQVWTKGVKGAKIQITEYSDFQCPYCQKGSEIMAKVYEKYKNDIEITFMHFPLTEIHPYALSAAKAAEAAGYQGKFWEMHDLLFANQKNLTRDDLLTYAKKLNLDIDKFTKYLDNKNIENKILKQADDIKNTEFDELTLDDNNRVISKGKGKINGTPAFIINGKLVAGAYPVEAFDKFIELSTKK